MLKKLAKYGNSTTLVIDRAILELLNMDESTIVKLQTDGTSLIITPVKSTDVHKKISYETQEALIAANESFGKTRKSENVDPALLANAKKDFVEVFKKHETAFSKFNTEILPSKEFQDALASLTDTIDPVQQSEEYLKEFNKLRLKFCPELVDLQNEIEEVGKQHNKLSKKQAK